MKISRLITLLERWKTIHGDLTVTVLDPDQMEEGVIEGTSPVLCTEGDGNGKNFKATGLLLVDDATGDCLEPL